MAQIEIIGGTKTLNLDKIKALNPDLIIANKEENVKEQVAVLQNDFKVWVTDIVDLPSLQAFFISLGEHTQRQQQGEYFAKQLADWLPFNTVFQSAKGGLSHLAKSVYGGGRRYFYPQHTHAFRL